MVPLLKLAGLLFLLPFAFFTGAIVFMALCILLGWLLGQAIRLCQRL